LHHCLGAALARRAIRIMYEELLPRCSVIEATGPVEWGRSNKHTTIRHLPVRLFAA
jgi:cytochrome P450